MSKTGFLEPIEDIAYRRMLDYCYLNEKPLPNDIEEIAILVSMRTHSESIATVLRYFFELTDDGYINDRAQVEIEKYRSKSEKAKKSANARWDKKGKTTDNYSERNANASKPHSEGNANQEPRTKNHKPQTINQELETNNQQKDLDGFDVIYKKLKDKLVVSGVIPIGKPVIDEHLRPEIYSFVVWCKKKEMQDYQMDNAVVAFFKKKDIEDRKKYYTPPDDLTGRYYNADDYKKIVPVTNEQAKAIEAKHADVLLGLGF